MTILRVEHKVPNYDGWKKAFDADPINRRESGVRRYRVFRPVDDPNYVIIDLEFDIPGKAQSTLVSLQKLWVNVEGKVMVNAQARLLNVEETFDY
jgi:hypothetical protein